MSQTASTIFSSSGFAALIITRRYMSDHAVSWVEAAQALSTINPDFASSNLDAAFVLHDKVPELAFSEMVADLRSALDALIEAERPWWRKLFPSGRTQVLSVLTDDERQILADAGLLEIPPSTAVMAWWYTIQSRVRAEENANRSELGGAAELYTLDFERSRLASLGIGLEPMLVGFENIALGYDIRSYDVGAVAPVVRLIEVKSTTSTPPRMFLTRREWDAAKEYGPAFHFYIWWGQPAVTLSILTTAEVGAHVPQNNGDGSWTDVEIKFDPTWLLKRSVNHI